MCVGKNVISISRVLYKMYRDAYKNDCVETNGSYLLIINRNTSGDKKS